MLGMLLAILEETNKNRNKRNIRRSLIKIGKALEKSRTSAPLASKLKLAELILHLMKRKKPFGLFIILGWQNKWRKFTDMPDVYQDIFAKHHINIMNIKAGRRRRRDVSATVNFDGAILISSNGELLRSGVMIEGLRPRMIAQKVNPGQFNDLSEQFGFKKKVHLRHLTAITASYVFKSTTIYTVSEETGNFHIFENGRIIYSTIKKEL